MATGVVLDEPIGNHDVPDPQRWIEAACTPGEDDDPGLGLPDEQGGHRRQGHLANATLSQDDSVVIECTPPCAGAPANVKVRRRVERVTQRGKFRLKGRDHRNGAHGIHSPMLPSRGWNG